jgi:hypothetical protein
LVGILFWFLWKIAFKNWDFDDFLESRFVGFYWDFIGFSVLTTTQLVVVKTENPIKSQ